MRDPNRIPVILNKISDIWNKNPDLRLGQLLAVITDFELEEKLENLLSGR